MKSELVMTGCTVNNAKARIGSAMSASNGSTVSVTNSSFTNLEAKESSGILFAYSSTISITGSNFTNFSQGGINTDLLKSLVIEKSRFSYGRYDNARGGVINSQRSTQISIMDSVFDYNQALIGGVMYLSTQSDLPISNVYTLKRNKYRHN
jgi:hypothetical protein